jgi:hypothetical protein
MLELTDVMSMSTARKDWTSRNNNCDTGLRLVLAGLLGHNQEAQTIAPEQETSPPLSRFFNRIGLSCRPHMKKQSANSSRQPMPIKIMNSLADPENIR